MKEQRLESRRYSKAIEICFVLMQTEKKSTADVDQHGYQKEKF